MVVLLSACASPSLHKISDITEARALSDRGLELFAAGDHRGAIAALDAVVAYGTIDDSIYARRAAVHGTLKNYDRALADADRAVALAPRTWRRYLERAVLYQRSGQYESAISDLDSALALQPHEIELLRRRAYLKVVAQRFDDAVADYEDLSRAQPRSDTGALGRGAALYLSGRWLDAAAQFSRLLTTRPDDGLAALWLAKARLRGGIMTAWDDFEAQAGTQPEWQMTRALLTTAKAEELANLRGVTGPCEYALLVAVWGIAHGDQQSASSALTSAAKSCPTDSIEASEARVELARLRNQALKNQIPDARPGPARP